MIETVNIHWFQKSKLQKLRRENLLYRGRSATVQIKTNKELNAQIVRGSVWAYCSAVGIEPKKPEPLPF